jgi:excisionase family DNA binding protein
MHPTTPSAVLTVKEVQTDLRMSRNAVYEAIARGEIPSLKIGRRILIPKVPYQRMLNGDRGAPQ